MTTCDGLGSLSKTKAALHMLQWQNRSPLNFLIAFQALYAPSLHTYCGTEDNLPLPPTPT